MNTRRHLTTTFPRFDFEEDIFIAEVGLEPLTITYMSCLGKHGRPRKVPCTDMVTISRPFISAAVCRRLVWIGINGCLSPYYTILFDSWPFTLPGLRWMQRFGLSTWLATWWWAWSVLRCPVLTSIVLQMVKAAAGCTTSHHFRGRQDIRKEKNNTV